MARHGPRRRQCVRGDDRSREAHMKTLAGALWEYRHFVASSVANDLRSRFARSKLGASWMLLQPLAMVTIYALVLSEVMGARLPGLGNKFGYAIYLLSGMMLWTLFTEIVTRCLTVFVDNASLLKKVLFPRATLPVIVAGSAVVNNLLLAVAAIGVFALLGHMPLTGLAWLPVLLAVTAALALGLGLLLGTLNVFVRDVGQVMQVVLQLWFWLTPIVYVPSILPAGFQRWARFNPILPLVDAYHDTLVYDRAPSLGALLASAILAAVLLACATLLFRRAAPEMVDVL
jgi:lipopolysaccharide transport system permease protein